jgi:multiple sugar transport system permease protein
MIVTFIGAFQVFDPMFILTDGGPGHSTESVVLYVYRQAFQRFDVGYASAIAIVVFVVIATLSVIQFRLSRRWVLAND